MKIISGLYLIGIWIYSLLVTIASAFNTKARLLIKGRRNTWRQLKQYVNDEKCIWVHAASLGEFEQGRPIIEAIKCRWPNRKIVLSFYSPSGYEVRKNYNMVDLVCYLPADGPLNARNFINNINPEYVFFIKYEFWHFYLKELKRKNIPVYGVSMIFRKQQTFFKWYGSWFRDMLRNFAHIYVQDINSSDLLKTIKINNHTIAGDTRFDRVAKIAASSPQIELARRFVEGASMVLVAGSSWQPDEEIILKYINNPQNDVKLIIAPHEIDEERITQLCNNIKVPYFLYTKPALRPEDTKVMIINTIGLLSAIYKYGQIAYIGGGFGKGIHNTLEAATYGMPVIFGPNHKRFKEACDLIEKKAGFTINTYNEFTNVLDTLRTDIQTMATAKEQADKYVKSMCGASDLIMKEVFKV